VTIRDDIKDDIVEWGIIIGIPLVAVLIVLFIAMPEIHKMIDFQKEEAQWQEKWECIEWSGVAFGSGNITKNELYFAKLFLDVGYRSCNNTWNCLWEEGLVSNNTKISLYKNHTENVWEWIHCEINDTDSTQCDMLTRIQLTDDNCTKQQKVRVRK